MILDTIINTINAIIDAINSTADSAEYRVYSALYVVLSYILDTLVEWVEYRFPITQEPQPEPNNVIALHGDCIVDYQTGEIRYR